MANFILVLVCFLFILLLLLDVLFWVSSLLSMLYFSCTYLFCGKYHVPGVVLRVLPEAEARLVDPPELTLSISPRHRGGLSPCLRKILGRKRASPHSESTLPLHLRVWDSGGYLYFGLIFITLVRAVDRSSHRS